MATKTTKTKEQTWDLPLFCQRRDEILSSTMESLRDKIDSVYELLTEEERAELSVSPMDGEQYPNRLIKAILLAVAADVIDLEWNAETLKPKVAKVKRIVKNRPH